MGYGYDWMLHEPGAFDTEYQGVEHSVDFILAPVTAWEDRLRLEMTYDMAGELKWEELINKPSLIAQLGLLATRSPTPISIGKRDRYEAEYPYILRSSTLAREAIDWIWETYRVRLANRAHFAAYEEGSWGLEGICSTITRRFDYGNRYKELPERDPEEDFPTAMARLEEAGRHELYWVLQACGWNGWEQGAWLRFISEVDRARKDCAEAARNADDERQRIELELNGRSRTTQAPARTFRPRGGSYFAADYANQMREAFSANPGRIRRRGRYAFKALRTAADLTEPQERTVKRWLGYEGTAEGFDGFIERLYAAEGQLPPE